MPAQIPAKSRHFESSDYELVQQALAGDMSAFEILVERYNLTLKNWAYRVLRNHQQVEDVLQWIRVMPKLLKCSISLKLQQRAISTERNLFFAPNYNSMMIN